MEGNPSFINIIRSTWKITTVPTIHRAGSVVGLPKTWLDILQGSTWRLTHYVCRSFFRQEIRVTFQIYNWRMPFSVLAIYYIYIINCKKTEGFEALSTWDAKQTAFSNSTSYGYHPWKILVGSPASFISGRVSIFRSNMVKRAPLGKLSNHSFYGGFLRCPKRSDANRNQKIFTTGHPVDTHIIREAYCIERLWDVMKLLACNTNNSTCVNVWLCAHLSPIYKVKQKLIHEAAHFLGWGVVHHHHSRCLPSLKLAASSPPVRPWN